MKTGWKTTEFWLALVTQVLGILQLLGVIGSDQAREIGAGAGQAIGGLMMAGSAIGYAVARGMAKKGGKAIILFFAILSAAGPALADDTVTVASYTIKTQNMSKGVQSIVWSWATTDGTIASTAPIAGVTGTILNIYAVPGANTPTDDYDVAIISGTGGEDVINNAGVNLPDGNTAAEKLEYRRYPVEFLNGGPIFLFDETLSFSASGVGNNTNGTFYLYILLP